MSAKYVEHARRMLIARNVVAAFEELEMSMEELKAYGLCRGCT